MINFDSIDRPITTVSSSSIVACLVTNQHLKSLTLPSVHPGIVIVFRRLLSEITISGSVHHYK